MLSRVAESLYWIGRNMERAEDTARAVDVTYHSVLEEPPARRRRSSQWDGLLQINGDPDDFARNYSAADTRTVPDYLTFSNKNSSSILSCIGLARENARGLRDRISSEMWESLNTFYLWLREYNIDRLSHGNVHGFYQGVKERCHLFQGVGRATMLRGEGWAFLQAGRALERADMTARILSVQYAQLLPDERDESAAADIHQWISLLKSVSAYEAFRKFYHPGIDPSAVCEFLIFQKLFPRSIAFSVAEAEQALHDISGSPAGRFSNDAERLVGWLSADLNYGDVRGAYDRGLQIYLDDLQDKCNRIGDAIAQSYFVYRIPRNDEV
ncbi:MAG: alpha-E domain-containing protein [Chloroflexi bacterium]|nr:alpha-E domain-containing protein [Chloroflexota bacterium]